MFTEDYQEFQPLQVKPNYSFYIELFGWETYWTSLKGAIVPELSEYVKTKNISAN